VEATRSVRFTADGVIIAGTLHLPDLPGPQPAVLVAGPSPQVKEQVPDTYAARLADAGYVALTIDFRNFGESEGRPRLREDPAGKLVDLRAATSFLTARPEVDAERVAVVGICAGAGYALRAAAQDPRLAAFAGVAGYYPDPRTLRTAMGASGYRGALRQAIAVLEQEDRGGEVQYLPHVAPESGNALIRGGEAYEYYGSERGAAANYRNEITADTGFTMLTLDAATAADLVTVPALIVHGEKDEACPPQQAAVVHDRLGGPKRLEWLQTTTHIGFYDDDTYITPAIAAVVAFLDQHLG
jgi:dienelactone hydrolase